MKTGSPTAREMSTAEMKQVGGGGPLRESFSFYYATGTFAMSNNLKQIGLAVHNYQS